MSGFKLTRTATSTNPNVGDLYLDDKGDLLWLDDTPGENAETVAQRLFTRWRMMRGEWFIDQRQGTPWKEQIFRKGITDQSIKDIFRKVALGTPGVRSVDELKITRAGRTATIWFQVSLNDKVKVTASDLDEPFVLTLPEGL